MVDDDANSVQPQRLQPVPAKGVLGRSKTSDASLNRSAKLSEVESERGLELRYREQLRTDDSRPVQPDGPRNGSFTGTRIRAPKPLRLGLLHGRVALREPDPHLGGITEFYIGNAYAQVNGVDVYNWSAPMARSFFDSGPRDLLSDEVAAVRTFHHVNKLIVDFVDDIFCNDHHEPVFASHVPASSAKSPTNTPPAHRRDTTTPAVTHDAARFKDMSSERLSQSPENTARSPLYVRALPLLREQLHAPRAKKLRPVLATLQPEQYRLVATPSNESMIIEGGPGTGKSIIASHRASYLVGPDARSSAGFDGDVLLVGPTTGYVEYITDVVRELSGDSTRVTMLSLPELDSWTSPGNDLVAGKSTSSTFDRIGVSTGTTLASLIEAAKSRLQNGLNARLTEAQVYTYLKGNGTAWRPLTRESEWVKYLTRLPAYRQAIDTHAELLTSIESALTATPSRVSAQGSSASQPRTPNYRHIIVDEAQDVTLEEWFMLRTLNHRGAWTILGDLNQRRADKTPRNWTKVLRAIGVSPTTRRHTLELGYRSTMPILQYASKLLPPDADAPTALQPDGPGPTFHNPIREHVVSTVLKHLDQLLERHPGGTVAVITTMPGPINAKLGTCSGRDRVQVLGPNNARGLEFDAVVVIEPADFVPNDHRRYGLLYTALTRANKELVVVHSKALPAPLQQQSAIRAIPRPPTAQPTGSQVRKSSTKNAKSKRKPRLRRQSKGLKRDTNGRK